MQHSFNGAVLSRGRRLLGRALIWESDSASMEPSSAEDGDSVGGIYPTPSGTLQWSRPQQRTETPSRNCQGRPAGWCFNGAVLSRGRRRSTAGRCVIFGQRFNGAVLSRGRRPAGGGITRRKRRRFNGAVLSRGRRPPEEHLVYPVPYLLQWSRPQQRTETR